MTKANWIAGGAIVLVVLLLMLTFDPFGFLDERADDDAGSSYTGEMLEGPTLGGSGRKPLPNEDPTVWEGDAVGLLRLRLGSASLAGSVVSDGQPLRFARVRPVLAPPHDGLAVRTKKDGTWRIEGLSAGAHELRTSLAGYRSRSVTAPAIAGEQHADVPPIELQKARASTDAIEVRVTDMFGRPMPGAQVLATTMAWDLHLNMGPELVGVPGVHARSGTTDENGRITLGPLVAANYNVVAQVPGYVPGAVSNVVVAEGRTRHVALKMREGLSLQGVVEDMEGKPVAGAIVSGLAVPAFSTAPGTRSNADGTFLLDGLRKSNYMVFAFHETIGEVQSNADVPGGPVKLTLKGSGLIKGTVRRADGTPVAGGKIRPFGAGPFRYVYSMQSPIQEDGTYAVHVATGDWLLRAQAADGGLSEDLAVSVAAGETKELDIVVPTTGVVRGTVMDEAGQHIANAEVFVMKGGMPETPSREQYARTNADGAFEVSGLPIGAISLHVRHPEYRDEVLEFTPGPADSVREVSVRMVRGARITGRVSDPNGNGVEGEQVNLMITFMEARTTFTDENGAFELLAVKPGTYMMTTGPFEQGARGLRKSGITVGEAGVVDVQFQSALAAGRITGTVTIGGEPAVGVTVTVRDARGEEAQQMTKTDETGTYLVDGVEFGRVQVTAETSGGLRGAEATTVAEGDAPTRLDVTIGSAVVRGRAVDENGEPVSGAWTNVEAVGTDEQGWSVIKASGHTDESGRYEAKGLEPGTYRMRLNLASYAQFLSDTVTVEENGVADLGDLRLTRGVQITGIVRNDAGSPVEKATASLADPQGRPIFLFSMATTGSDGRYALRGIEPGQYRLRIEAKGHGPFEADVDCSSGSTSVDGTLTRGGSVSVAVEDDGGQPLPGVRVFLLDRNGQVVTKTISMANFDSGQRSTGASGETALDDLAAGSYTIRCEKQGYEVIGSVPGASVKPGERAAVRVIMQAIP
jgi:protocatechuate 3,4-dioxygenase beta subunit